jgi:hypothetical protein
MCEQMPQNTVIGSLFEPTQRAPERQMFLTMRKKSCESWKDFTASMTIK